MASTHLEDHDGRPVGADDVESVDGVARVVTQATSERRHVVDVDGEALACQVCNGADDCEHAQSARRALASMGLFENADDWRAVAAQLHAHGVPERRAEVVALVANGHTHQEVADELDIERANVATHVRRYREELADARWLAENAPDI